MLAVVKTPVRKELGHSAIDKGSQASGEEDIVAGGRRQIELVEEDSPRFRRMGQLQRRP